jgi:hypothetical protein
MSVPHNDNVIHCLSLGFQGTRSGGRIPHAEFQYPMIDGNDSESSVEIREFVDDLDETTDSD